jgi:hypothetical protein
MDFAQIIKPERGILMTKMSDIRFSESLWKSECPYEPCYFYNEIAYCGCCLPYHARGSNDIRPYVSSNVCFCCGNVYQINPLSKSSICKKCEDEIPKLEEDRASHDS